MGEGKASVATEGPGLNGLCKDGEARYHEESTGKDPEESAAQLRQRHKHCENGSTLAHLARSATAID